ncbi:response regulator [bacterium]|nr:response regulator [bacterium]
MKRVLVVEDHRELLRSLERGLSASGYDIVTAETAESAFYCASTDRFDAIVLDVMLPERSGLEVLRDLRNAGMDSPVLILSARTSVEDRVRGLDEGADDYLIKPFAFEELLARLRALLNRRVPGRKSILTAGDLELHVPTQTVLRAGREISLSKLEYRLLEYLVRHRNSTVDRNTISRDVWNEPQGAASNIVDVYINSLRKKLDWPGSTKLIHTVRGVGYSLRTNTEADDTLTGTEIADDCSGEVQSD